MDSAGKHFVETYHVEQLVELVHDWLAIAESDMRYIEFKELIRKELIKHPDGLTWEQLKSQLKLPYNRPCQTWIEQMENESGLSRARGTQRALIWTIPATQDDN